ncbi:hypothetical protein GCM10022630_15710 [Thermobifida alba]
MSSRAGTGRTQRSSRPATVDLPAPGAPATIHTGAGGGEWLIRPVCRERIGPDQPVPRMRCGVWGM